MHRATILLLAGVIAGCGEGADVVPVPSPPEPFAPADADPPGEESAGDPQPADIDIGILLDVEAWDSAAQEERRTASEHVDSLNAAFALSRLETFTCGGETHQVAIFDHDETGLEFVLIPTGTFLMGSPESEDGRGPDETRHRVTLTHPFLISRTECTERAYRSRGHATDDDPPERAALPKTSLDWTAATAWCEGLGMRLPTEAEWEYACRAGTTTAFHFGDDDSRLGEYAWYGAQMLAPAHPVGTREPNAFGLHDMHGNVHEWCEDGYAEWTYLLGDETDPAGVSYSDVTDTAPPPGGELRVARGGTSRTSRGLRSAKRGAFTPGRQDVTVGFRPVADVRLE